MSLATRASDFERDHVAARLWRGTRRGQLSLDTFVARVDRAYAAKTRDQLETLTGDLPTGPAWMRGLRHRHAGSRRALMPLAPPSDGPLLVGRAPDCALVLDDPTVSRHHAKLWRSRGDWVLTDLDSTNGTRVNGWRLERDAVVHAGDEIRLGDLRLAFIAR